MLPHAEVANINEDNEEILKRQTKKLNGIDFVTKKNFQMRRIILIQDHILQGNKYYITSNIR